MPLSRLVRRWSLWTGILLSLAMGPRWGVTAPPEWPRFLVDSAAANMSAALDRQSSVVWSDVPLELAIGRLGEIAEFPCWRHPLVDPTRKLSLEARDEPLGDVLEMLAQQSGAVPMVVGGTVAVVPARSAAAIETYRALARQRLEELRSPVSIRLASTGDRRWSRLTTPATVVSEIAAELGGEVQGIDLVPHDLWPAGSWRQVTLADQLLLALLPYGLVWELDQSGNRLSIVLAKPAPVLTASYSVDNLAAAIERLPRDRPGLEIRQQRTGSGRGKLVVRGSAAGHAEFATALGLVSREPRRTVAANRPASVQVYSLTVRQQPASAILDRLAIQLDRSVEASEEARGRLQARVDITVEQATLEDLIAAVGKAAGVSISLPESAPVIDVRAGGSN